MTIADKALAAAFRFEAKLHAFRKTQDGIVVSFVVSPIDLPSQLALDPLGTRYVVAMVGVDDQEQPVTCDTSAKMAVRGALLASDAADRKNPKLSVIGKDNYRHDDDMGRARVRSVLLAKDMRFRAWATERDDVLRPIETEANARQFILDYCRIASRSEIGENRSAYDKFIGMETDYLRGTGQMAELREGFETQ